MSYAMPDGLRLLSFAAKDSLLYSSSVRRKAIRRVRCGRFMAVKIARYVNEARKNDSKKKGP